MHKTQIIKFIYVEGYVKPLTLEPFRTELFFAHGCDHVTWKFYRRQPKNRVVDQTIPCSWHLPQKENAVNPLGLQHLLFQCDRWGCFSGIELLLRRPKTGFSEKPTEAISNYKTVGGLDRVLLYYFFKGVLFKASFSTWSTIPRQSCSVRLWNLPQFCLLWQSSRLPHSSQKTVPNVRARSMAEYARWNCQFKPCQTTSALPSFRSSKRILLQHKVAYYSAVHGNWRWYRRSGKEPIRM